MSESRPTRAEMIEWERARVLAQPHEIEPLDFPRLDTFSPAFMFQFVPVPEEPPAPPEYVYVRNANQLRLEGEARARYDVFLTEWNTLWEARRERPDILQERMPAQLAWIENVDADLRLVPRGERTRYDAYASLFHLLPAQTLQRFGLPLLKRGVWPFWVQDWLMEELLPRDFDARLEQALSYHLWPLLARGAPTAFGKDEPIRLLSHNLDFWMPFADMVAQERMRARGRVPIETEKQQRLLDEGQAQMPSGVRLERPLYGGAVWSGEDDAWEATEEMVRLGDEHGRLRGILDAVRSHRVEEDFTDRWSYEREDFERKLHRKRSAVRVRFVELNETIPVHGPESEVHEHLLWEDFFAVVDAKEREIVICLRSGLTRVGEIADELGYANHSPISKKLARIRKKAAVFFGLN